MNMFASPGKNTISITHIGRHFKLFV